MSLHLHQGGADDAAEAAAWVVRLAADDAGFDDFEAFDAWLAASPGRPAAYDRALSLWTTPLEGAAPVVSEPKRPFFARPAAWMGGMATAAAIAAAIAFVAAPRAERYVTAPGEQREIALRDGTHVALNAASTLEVRWSAHARRLKLPQGEAQFDVSHDPARPFTIESGNRSVRVVGTAFDVKARGADLDVTVSRGIVEVRGSREAPPLRLVRGDQARFTGLQSVARLAKVDPEEATSWRTGRLIYHDASVGEVVQALNLQFGPPTIHVSEAASRMRFSGVLKLDSRDQVVRRLTAALPIDARRDASGLTLTSATAPR